MKKHTKEIKLETFWISDNYSSEDSKNSVYKTTGFIADFKKDRYYESCETILYYNKDNKLVSLYEHDNDIKAFKTQGEAVQFRNEKRLYWINWYKEQIKEYTEKLKTAEQ